MVEESTSTAPYAVNSSQGDLGFPEIHPAATLRKHENSVDSVTNNPKDEN